MKSATIISSFRKKSILITTLVILLVGGGIAYLYFSPKAYGRLWLSLMYDNVRPLDTKGRCMIVELTDNQKDTNKERTLKFYDLEKRVFLHLPPYPVISSVKEIRSGAYALFTGSGVQKYSIVMPYADEDEYGSWYSLNGDIEIIDCAIGDNIDSYVDDSRAILNPDVMIAESQLIEEYEKNEQCGYLLMDYVKNRPSTLQYDFKRLNEKTNVSVITSPDKRLRFYSWDTETGGTSPNFASYVQYDNGRDIIVDALSAYQNSQYVCVHDITKDGYNPVEGSYIDRLYQVSDSTDNPVYIATFYNRASSAEGWQTAYALTIRAGKLIKIPIFETNDELTTDVDCGYYIPDWYFTTDGLGWDWVMSYDATTKTLYVPAVENMVMTDRYHLYKWTDGKMKHSGTDAGYWLNPSLHDFSHLCGIYRTKTKLLRIDRLADNTFRYAAWSRNVSMRERPELVLTGGKDGVIENALVFENPPYEYIVPAYRQGSSDDFGKVIIRKNGKVISDAEV